MTPAADTLAARLDIFSGDALDAWITAAQEMGHTSLPVDNGEDAWRAAAMIACTLGIAEWYIINRDPSAHSTGTWHMQIVGAPQIDEAQRAEDLYQLRLAHMRSHAAERRRNAWHRRLARTLRTRIAS